MTSDYDAAKTAPVERVARVLAGHALSRNAEGDMGSAGPAVDDLWPDYAPAAPRRCPVASDRAVHRVKFTMPRRVAHLKFCPKNLSQ